jgi:L-ascorbate metabolism protein UlaG (beta-lactamase superfamily)
LGNLEASVVTISNNNWQHNNTENIKGEPTLFNSAGEYEYNGISVQGVMTSLTEGQSFEDRNIAYNILISGIHILHLGDIATPLTPSQIDELLPCDILLTPIGGSDTLPLDDIMQTIQDLDPNIIIPMQYNVPGVELTRAELDPFLNKLGKGEVTPQNRITLSKSNVESSTMELNTLNPQGKPTDSASPKLI